jgi:cysteine desulfurase
MKEQQGTDGGRAPGRLRKQIYLDHNATTPVDPEAAEAMMRVLREEFGNPSSAHSYGRRAREIVEEARREVAHLIDSKPDEIVFTSGGTESNNLAILGAARAEAARRRLGPGLGAIVTCRGEHPAVLEPCAFLERSGFRVTRLPIDRTGLVDPEAVRSAIAPDTVLVTVMHANNETGTIGPIAEIARIAHERGVIVHTDAAQSTGKIPTPVGELEVDLLTIAGHKLYAPKGAGALFVRRGIAIDPLLLGASQERGIRAGTEAVHQAAGLGAACRIARREMTAASERMESLRDLLHALLEGAIPGLSLNGHPDRRLPNTLNVNFPGVSGASLLERAGAVAASTGSACHAGETKLSPVLAAMGVPPEVGRGAVRLSLGRRTTRAEIEEAAAALAEAYRSLSS